MFKYFWIIMLILFIAPFIIFADANFILTIKENIKKRAKYIIGAILIILFYASLYFFLWG